MGLLDSFDIGSSGLAAHGKRLEIAAKNMANIDTPNYVRKIPILMAKEDISFQGLLGRMKDDTFKTGLVANSPGGVSLSGVMLDPSPGDKVYSPGHPDADRNGYIRRSNVSPIVEMADANMAARAYEANLAIINLAKTMAQKVTEVGR